MKHTKGNWQLTSVPFELRNTDSAASIYGPNSNNNGACLIADISRSPGDKEAEANAKLIAAAPHMLSKCEEIYHDITIIGDETIEDLKTMLEAARAKALSAIKKATE